MKVRSLGVLIIIIGITIWLIIKEYYFLGNVTRKYKITAKYASKNIIEKIKKAGGEIILKEG